jgi:hypothetical protein
MNLESTKGSMGTAYWEAWVHRQNSVHLLVALLGAFCSWSRNPGW